MKPFCLFWVLLVSSSLSVAGPFNRLTEKSAIPDFSLTTQHGNSFTRDDLIGKWTLVLVGFTSCPDVCPYTLGNLEHVLAETTSKVRPDNLPEVVFLAVDPARDEKTLGAYVNYFHPNFVGVTGKKEDIDAFVKGLGAFYQLDKPDSSGGYNVRHSADIRVIDPNGMLHATIETPMKAYETSDFLLKLQVDYRRNLQ
ncbi:MAG: SCO family protein [Granulosicoccus sp.]